MSILNPPVPSVAHRTVTALWGKYPPLASLAAGVNGWAANPSNIYGKARFMTDLVVRGCTALGDAPSLTFRPYVRHGGSSGYVGVAESITFSRPRLIDLTSIKCQKTVNNGAAYTDYSAAVVDNNAATQADLDALDTVANGDWAVFGGPVPFCGVALDLDAGAVNGNAVIATWEYWNGAAWAALTNVTDGTIAVGGRTLSGDGQVSWDMPADWAASAINGIPAYWARLSVNAALSAAVDVEEVDLLMPIKAAIDVVVDGDDAMLVLESQDTGGLTGTLAYSGSIRVSWR